MSRQSRPAVLTAIGLGVVAALAVAARGGELDDRDWQVLGTVATALFCGSAALPAVRLGAPTAFAALRMHRRGEQP